MNSSLNIFVLAVCVISLLSFIWYLFYSRYLQRNEYEIFVKKSNNQGMDYKVSLLIEPYLCMETIEDTCSMELSNTDDDVAETLEYIESATFARNLLEVLYEQSGI